MMPLTNRGSRRVLVVDDSDDLGASLAAALELLGFDARSFTDGRDALACMASWKPAIVFLDLTMPALSGIDVLHAAHACEWSAGMVMIAMTGWDASAQREQALVAGFDHFVEKPFDLDVLSALLTPFTDAITEDRPTPISP
jgi:DNA-binding response OmpR family regulator